MNKSKKEFCAAYLIRTVLFGLLLAGVVLLPKDGLNRDLLPLFVGALIATAYYGILWAEGTVRLVLAFLSGNFGGHRMNYAIVDDLGKVPAIVVTTCLIGDMILYWAFLRVYSAGAIMIGAVAPVVAFVEWVAYAPREKKFRFYPVALILPALYALIRAISEDGATDAVIKGVVIVAVYFATATALFFVAIKAKRWEVKKMPYPLLWHDMPVDISSAFGVKEVAGSHGFLKTEGENFVFEDGTPVKFWGVNFNSAQNFPEYSHSEKVARRLARAGVNMVRFHQLDAEWSSPNIFAFKKGERLTDSRHFDKESLDRLDYLVYCLKNEGIYIYLDFLTYRRFRVGDGVENAESLPEAAKPYNVFDRKLIELQKEYNRKLLTHVNKYTGVAYKDEPAIALAEVVNECDLLDAEYTKITVEPYRSRLLERYREYAGEQGVKDLNEDIDKRTDPFLRKFLLEVQKSYVREIIDDIRAVGGKFPMTAMNRESDRTVILTNGVTDFSDSHAYWRGGTQSGFMNDPMSLQKSNAITRQLFTNAIENKPFFVSEWDAPWPNEFRADVTLWTAAVGALQNWSGFTLHTYRYGTTERDCITEKLGRSIALGGSYSRGLFDCYNDPAKMGLFYHAALIMRRGDVAPAKETDVYRLSEEDYLSCKEERHLKKIFPERSEEVKKVRFGVGEKDEQAREKISETIISDTQELYRDVKKGIGKIDSGRTQVVYGFCQGKTKLKDVTIDVKNDFATVAISSLNDLPIAETDSLLLTAVGRADNKNVKYNFFHNALKEEGEAPILADVIEAKIALRTKYPDLKVWAVNNEGCLIGQMKTSYDGEYLHFSIGKKFESVFYLVQRQ